MDLKAQVSNVEEVEGKGVAHNHIAGNALLLNADGGIRRLPIPSSDPNDPLNFPLWMKAGIIVSSCWFAIMSLAVIGGLGAILETFMELYGREGYNPNTILLLSTLPSLMVGIGNYIVLPFALAYGRRPAFLMAALCLVISTAGCAASTNFAGHLTGRVFQGLTAGATESLLPLMLTEITFMHQRALVFGLYWSFQTAFSSALSLGSSYETAALSWRWYYGIFTIAAGIGLFLGIFFSFETRFSRPATSINGHVIVTDEFGVTRILDEDEGRAYLAAHMSYDSEDQYATPKLEQSYTQRLGVWSGKSPRAGRIIIEAFRTMMQSLTSPGIVYAILVPSITIGSAVAISLTYNDVLVNHYGWPAKSVGLINIAPMPAAFLAMAAAGYGGDRITLWAARRNGGVAIPEHRLIPLIIPFVTGIVGMLLYAFTADNSSHNGSWAGPVLGWGIFEFAFVCTLITSTTFAAECWPQNPGPALVLVVGTKNIISFAISYALNYMVTAHGYKWSIGVLTGVFAGVFIAGVPIYFINPRWRKRHAEKEAARKSQSSNM
ncbi:HOL1 (member of major facilitator superfamily) protein [Rutstroemia sp. NJR-2017a BBW]|nr:HOL1 (member of major facilitator superfamily) protein [Rutstroemia sp. NJR-2017a BBW]